VERTAGALHRQLHNEANLYGPAGPNIGSSWCYLACLKDGRCCGVSRDFSAQSPRSTTAGMSANTAHSAIRSATASRSATTRMAIALIPLARRRPQSGHLLASTGTSTPQVGHVWSVEPAASGIARMLPGDLREMRVVAPARRSEKRRPPAKRTGGWEYTPPEEPCHATGILPDRPAALLQSVLTPGRGDSIDRGSSTTVKSSSTLALCISDATQGRMGPKDQSEPAW
jgi:hypothetical protein